MKSAFALKMLKYLSIKYIIFQLVLMQSFKKRKHIYFKVYFKLCILLRLRWIKMIRTSNYFETTPRD